MNSAVQKKADEPNVWEKPMPASLSMMQSRGTSVHPYLARLQQGHQSGHRDVSLPSMQRNWPMKEESCMLTSESCQQPSQVLSPSVVSLEHRNRIQNARLQGSSTSSTSPCSLTSIGENKRFVQSPMASTKASSAAIPQEQGNWIRNARLEGPLMPSASCSQSLFDEKKRCVQSPLASTTASPIVVSQEPINWIPNAKLQRSSMSSASPNFQALIGENKLCVQSSTASITSPSAVFSQDPRNRVQNSRLQGSHMLNTSPCSQSLIGENKRCVQSPIANTSASSAVISQEQRNPIQNARLQGSHMSSTSLKHRFQSSTASTTAPSAVMSQEQINQISIAKLQGSSKSITSLNSQTIIGEDKHNIQSPITSTTASSAYTSFPVAQDIDLSDWKPLIIQFQRARSLYLPGLVKLYKRAQERCFQEQNVPNKSDSMIKFSGTLRQMIQFLHLREDDLTTKFSKEKVYYALNKTAEFCRIHLRIKNIMSGEGQVPQPISSCPQPSSLNSPICSDAHAKSQADKETLACQGPKGTADNYAHHEVKLSPRVSQSSNENQSPKVPQSRKRKTLPEKEVDFMNSMFPPVSSKLPRSFSAKTGQKKNTSFSLDPSAKPQPNPMRSTVDLPSTSVSPSIISKDTGKHAKKPLERLIHAVQSMSKEALRSSIDDIASVMMVMDKSPEYASDVDLRSANHLQAMCDDCIPHKHMKHDFESMGSYVSTLDNSGSCTKRDRDKLVHFLMNEIREINQRLIETVIEVVSDSDSSNAIVIKCTYTPVPSNVNLARHVASIASLTTLSIKFLIPSDYPSSPPKILDRLPVGSCKESIDWMEKLNSQFNRRVRGLISLGLGEMARAWDETARSVYSDFVFSLGGGSFSSKYGSWECVSAT